MQVMKSATKRIHPGLEIQARRHPEIKNTNPKENTSLPQQELMST